MNNLAIELIALGFDTFCYDAEYRGVKPSVRIKDFHSNT